MNLNFQKTDLQENENQRVTVAPRVAKKGKVEVEEVYENNWDLRRVYKLSLSVSMATRTPSSQHYFVKFQKSN